MFLSSSSMSLFSSTGVMSEFSHCSPWQLPQAGTQLLRQEHDRVLHGFLYVNLHLQRTLGRMNFGAGSRSVFTGLITSFSSFHPQSLGSKHSIFKYFHCDTRRSTLKEWKKTARSVGGRLSGSILSLKVASLYFACRRWANVSVVLPS